MGIPNTCFTCIHTSCITGQQHCIMLAHVAKLFHSKFCLEDRSDFNCMDYMYTARTECYINFVSTTTISDSFLCVYIGGTITCVSKAISAKDSDIPLPS